MGLERGRSLQRAFLPWAKGTLAGFVAVGSQAVVWRMDWCGVTHDTGG